MHAQPQHQLLSTQLQLSAASYQARTLRHTAQRGSALLDLQHLTLTTRPAEPVLLSTSTCLRTTRCAVGCWKGKLAQRGGDEAQQATTSCTGSKGPRASDRRLSVSNIRAWQEDPAAEQLCCRWFGLSAQRGKSHLSRKVQAERTVMKHARHCWLLEESGRFTRTRGTRMLSAQRHEAADPGATPPQIHLFSLKHIPCARLR